MTCSIAMLMDKRNDLSLERKDYSGFGILWKDRGEGKHVNFAKITVIKVWIEQWIFKRQCFPGLESKSDSSTYRCVRVRFILPGTTYPVYTCAVVVLRIISYTRVMLMTNDRPTARPTTSASAVVVASSVVPATRSSSQFSSAVKSTFCRANFVAW